MNFVSIDLHKKTITVCVVNEAAGGRGWVPRVRSSERVPSGPRANTVELAVKSWQAVGYFALSPCGRG